MKKHRNLLLMMLLFLPCFIVFAACSCSAPTTYELKSNMISIEEASYTYTGAAIEPEVTVTVDGTVVTAAGNYTVTYENNTNVGTATITVTAVSGSQILTGSASISFTIVNQVVEASTLEELKGYIADGNYDAIKITESIVIPAGDSVIVPADTTLTIESGKTLTISAGAEFVNSGIIANNGTIECEEAFSKGNFSNEGTIKATVKNADSYASLQSIANYVVLDTNVTINDSFVIPAGETVVINAEKVLTIGADATYDVKGTLINNGQLVVSSKIAEVQGEGTITANISNAEDLAEVLGWANEVNLGVDATISATDADKIAAGTVINVGEDATLTLNKDVQATINVAQGGEVSAVVTTSENLTQGLINKANTITVDGNITVNSELTVPANTTLQVTEGSTLTVNSPLTNNGSIANEGTINTTSPISGTITGAGNVVVSATLGQGGNLTDLLTQGATVITITADTTITVEQNALITADHTIIVSEGVNVTFAYGIATFAGAYQNNGNLLISEYVQFADGKYVDNGTVKATLTSTTTPVSIARETMTKLIALADEITITGEIVTEEVNLTANKKLVIKGAEALLVVNKAVNVDGSATLDRVDGGKICAQILDAANLTGGFINQANIILIATDLTLSSSVANSFNADDQVVVNPGSTVTIEGDSLSAATYCGGTVNTTCYVSNLSKMQGGKIVATISDVSNFTSDMLNQADEVVINTDIAVSQQFVSAANQKFIINADKTFDLSEANVTLGSGSTIEVNGILVTQQVLSGVSEGATGMVATTVKTVEVLGAALNWSVCDEVMIISDITLPGSGTIPASKVLAIAPNTTFKAEGQLTNNGVLINYGTLYLTDLLPINNGSYVVAPGYEDVAKILADATTAEAVTTFVGSGLVEEIYLTSSAYELASELTATTSVKLIGKNSTVVTGSIAINEGTTVELKDLTINGNVKLQKSQENESEVSINLTLNNVTINGAEVLYTDGENTANTPAILIANKVAATVVALGTNNVTGAVNAAGIGIAKDASIDLSGETLKVVGNGGYEFIPTDKRGDFNTAVYYNTSLANADEDAASRSADPDFINHIANSLADETIRNKYNREKGGTAIGTIFAYAIGETGKIKIHDMTALTAEGYGRRASGIGGKTAQPIEIVNTTIKKVKGGLTIHHVVGGDSWGKGADEGGAAIGTMDITNTQDGNKGVVGTIKLDNVNIESAYGGSKAAAIGGAYYTAVVVEIKNSTLTNIYGGHTAAAIGGGRYNENKDQTVDITIIDSTITNTFGGDYGAGIGSGYSTDCRRADRVSEDGYNQAPLTTINISGNSRIQVTGGVAGAGIGTGHNTARVTGEIASTVNTYGTKSGGFGELTFVEDRDMDGDSVADKVYSYRVGEIYSKYGRNFYYYVAAGTEFDVDTATKSDGSEIGKVSNPEDIGLGAMGGNWAANSASLVTKGTAAIDSVTGQLKNADNVTDVVNNYYTSIGSDLTDATDGIDVYYATSGLVDNSVKTAPVED